MIRTACPNCEEQLKLDDRYAGRRVKCPACNGIVAVPPPVGEWRKIASSDEEGLPERATTKVGPVKSRSSSRPKGESARQGAVDRRDLSVSAKLFGALCLLLSLCAVGALAWHLSTRDPWEAYNSTRMHSLLNEAEDAETSDPLKAYKLYDEILKEAGEHKVASEYLRGRLASAKQSRDVLLPTVRVQIEAEQAEKRRQAEEEARQAQAESDRLAEEKRQRIAEREASRIALESKKAEEDRRKEEIAKAKRAYSNPPATVRTTLNAVKKLEARTEVGINYRDYSTVVGETWAEVKVFADSPDGRSVPEFTRLIVSSVDKYRLALDVWKEKFGDAAKADDALSDAVLQECWVAASTRLKVAESLLDPSTLERGMSRTAVLDEADRSYEKTVRSLFVELFLAGLQSQLVKMDRNDAKNVAEYRKRIDEVKGVLTSLRKRDSGSD